MYVTHFSKHFARVTMILYFILYSILYVRTYVKWQLENGKNLVYASYSFEKFGNKYGSFLCKLNFQNFLAIKGQIENIKNRAEKRLRGEGIRKASKKRKIIFKKRKNTHDIFD